MTVNGFSTLQIGMGWFSEQPGGLNRFYQELLQNLPYAGVGARGLVTGSPAVDRDSHGMVTTFASSSEPLPLRMWKSRRAVGSALEDNSLDLAVSHFALYTFPALDRISSKLPLVVHFQGPWASEGGVEGRRGLNTRAKAALERAVYRHGARFIVLSQAFGEVLHREYGVPEEVIRVVPGAVEVDLYDTGVSRAEARERLGWPGDRPVILAVRRLARRMGLEDLIGSFVQVRERVPDALLMIAGKGPLSEDLDRKIRHLELEDDVRLLGFVPDEDLPLAYRAADLTVVPTVALEGFGLITVESLAAGTPVLVTPVGGLPEVVRDLSPSLVLPGTGSGPLGEGIVSALNGELELPEAGECRDYARARYDWPVIAGRVSEVYREALK